MIFFKTKIQIEATTQGGGGCLNNSCKLSQTTRAYVLFSGKKRKKSQKCCAFVPTPIYAEGSVFMCVFVYIIQLNTVISAICVCVCVCYCAFQWIKFKKCASLLTFWWIVQFYWTKVKSSEHFLKKSSSNQPFRRLSLQPLSIFTHTRSFFHLFKKKKNCLKLNSFLISYLFPSLLRHTLFW